MSINYEEELPRASSLAARLEALSAKARAKAVTTKNFEAPKIAPTNVPRATCSEEFREVPNIALRSALFGAIGKGKRRYLEREMIYTQKNTSIIYTGVQLDQGDLDVWETILHIVRTQPLGQDCCISTYKLLQLLGNSDTGANRKVLKRRLSRLSASALDVKIGYHTYYEGSLINEILRDENNGRSIIRLNPHLSKMFESDQFTRINWQVRQSLKGKFLAQWLHGYYSSHATPYPVRIQTLHQLSGSNSVHQSKFRQQLSKALSTLREVCNAHGQPFNYQLEDGLVRIEKTPSNAQSRHIAKRKSGNLRPQMLNDYRRNG